MAGAAVLLGGAILVWGYIGATSDPTVRRARIELTGWPSGAIPVRAVLISDIHVAGPDMNPARLAEIVAQINALSPDLVLIAGDFISEKVASTHRYGMREAIAPLVRLTPRLGTFAVLGNHNYWFDAEGGRAALSRAGVILLSNDAARAGPLVIGGLDDEVTNHADMARTLGRMRGLAGARIMLSHSPDPFAAMPGDIGLMLAGHTHCGQIAPFPVGPIITQSRFGLRYGCGRIREGGKTLIVTAGLGTSGLPLRIGAVPDLWLLTLGSREEKSGG